MQAYTLSVSKFNNIVRDIFNSEELLHNIKIVGEVFGMSNSKSAVYFSVKDEESSLPCVYFYGDILRDVQEGDMVVLTGSPNFYAKSGRFNFVVSKVEPVGVGLLFQQFMALKEKLEKEGLFDESHKKPLPKDIKRIGVVTSKDGAVIQDIKNVSWRRNPGVDIVLFDTKVQGNDAEKEIAEGIRFFSEYDGVDVVIVARGGGSLEDLSAYNTELVARAAYECKKPLVSAVGHETDFSILDFVADLRAPTPSAAAELLTKDILLSKNTFKRELTRLSIAMENFLNDKLMQFNSDKNNFVMLAEDFVFEKHSKLQKMAQKISNKLDEFVKQADFGIKLKIASLEKLNPLDILSMGYAKIEQENVPIGKIGELSLKKPIDINFVDGKITIVPKQ